MDSTKFSPKKKTTTTSLYGIYSLFFGWIEEAASFLCGKSLLRRNSCYESIMKFVSFRYVYYGMKINFNSLA